MFPLIPSIVKLNFPKQVLLLSVSQERSIKTCIYLIFLYDNCFLCIIKMLGHLFAFLFLYLLCVVNFDLNLLHLPYIKKDDHYRRFNIFFMDYVECLRSDLTSFVRVNVRPNVFTGLKKYGNDSVLDLNLMQDR